MKSVRTRTCIALGLLSAVAATVTDCGWRTEKKPHGDSQPMGWHMAAAMVQYLDRLIDPEEVRAWAMPYLTNTLTAGDPPMPPVRIARALRVERVSAGVSSTGNRGVSLWIQEGGFGPYERIMVGERTSTISTQGMKPSSVRIKWRDGIYYAVDFN